MFLRLRLQQLVARSTDQKETEKHAHPTTDVYQPYCAGGEAVDFLEDKCEGCIQKIEDSIDQSAIDRH